MAPTGGQNDHVSESKEPTCFKLNSLLHGFAPTFPMALLLNLSL